MPYEKIAHDQSRIIIGTKQALKAIRKHEVNEVYIADDADSQLTEPVAILAKELNIPCYRVQSMEKLGSASGIGVGTSTVAIKK